MQEVLRQGFAVHTTHSAKLWPRSGKGRGKKKGKNHTFSITILFCASSQPFPKAHSLPMDTSEVQPSLRSCGSPGEGHKRGQSPGTPSHSLQTDMHHAHLLYTCAQPDSNATKAVRSLLFQGAGLVALGTAQDGI